MVLLPLVLALAAALPAVASAAPKTVWLCKPGMAADPCGQSQRTTIFTPGGEKVRAVARRPRARRKIDCFYVYPTVSDQKSDLSTLRIDPEQRSIALFQAARYTRECRVFAPMYRQHTIAWLLKSRRGEALGPLVAPESVTDVRRAWRSYLKHHNRGRGVVLIGHSQGTYVLRRFIASEIDPKPALRRRLVSALLLGGNVTVKRKGDVGGDFKHIRACRRPAQTGCVIAFSVFGETPPDNTLFGRPRGDEAPSKRVEVLCTNPAALGGGSGLLDPEYPSAPFAPGTTIAAAVGIVGNTLPKASTPWIAVPNAYRARCSRANGANVLRIAPRGGAPALKPSPDPSWGLHLVDANIALGNLVQIVRAQAVAFAKRR
jgi:hypothetical protein